MSGEGYSIKNLNFSYKKEDSNPYLINNFNLNLSKNDRIAIIGKNGKGKSTLLNLIANELSPISGNIELHSTGKRGHFGQTNISRLNYENTIFDEILSSNDDLTHTKVRNICGTMMFSGTLAEKKIKVLSGGERSRVLLGKLLAQPTNILLLDEPTNHLDMQSVDSLGEEIKSYPGALLIVTHNESLLRKVAKKLIVFHKNTIEIFDGTYDEFIEKVGWEEENSTSEGNKKTISKKDYKELKATIIQERSQKLSPIKKVKEKLEIKIEAEEKLLKEVTKTLLRHPTKLMQI